MAKLTNRDRFKQLTDLVQKRDRAIARNNAAALQNLSFRHKLAVSRTDPRHAQANAAVANVYNLAAQQQGMNGWEIAAIGSVFAMAIVAAASLVYWQLQREEREYSAEHPFQATFTTATNMVFWVVAGGVVVIGGLMYWDYRQRQQHLFSGASTRPFDKPRGGSRVDAQRFKRDIGKMKGDVDKFLSDVKVSGRPDETIVDSEMEDRMAEELAIQQAFERDQQRPAPVLFRQGRFGFR